MHSAYTLLKWYLLSLVMHVDSGTKHFLRDASRMHGRRVLPSYMVVCQWKPAIILKHYLIFYQSLAGNSGCITRITVILSPTTVRSVYLLWFNGECINQFFQGSNGNIPCSYSISIHLGIFYMHSQKQTGLIYTFLSSSKGLDTQSSIPTTRRQSAVLSPGRARTELWTPAEWKPRFH